MDILTVGELKKLLESVPDNYELYVPIWGWKTAPVEEISISAASNRVNIIAEVA